MPLYEYACEKCGKVFEVIEKFSDQPLTVHKDCGGKVERLLSAPALHFKGSGFYITDYAKGNGNANAPKSSESKNSEGKHAEGKSADGKNSESKKTDSKSSSEGSKTESSAPAASPAPAPSSSSTSSDSK